MRERETEKAKVFFIDFYLQKWDPEKEGQLLFSTPFTTKKFRVPPICTPLLIHFFFHTLSLSLSLKCTFYQLSSILMSHILYPHIYTYYSLSLSLSHPPHFYLSIFLYLHIVKRERLSGKVFFFFFLGLHSFVCFFSIFNQKLSSLPIFSTLFPYSKFIFFYSFWVLCVLFFFMFLLD